MNSESKFEPSVAIIHLILFFQIYENVTRRLLTLESESTLTFETTDLFIAVEEMQESGVCLISSHLEEKSMKLEVKG